MNSKIGDIDDCDVSYFLIALFYKQACSSQSQDISSYTFNVEPLNFTVIPAFTSDHFTIFFFLTITHVDSSTWDLGGVEGVATCVSDPVP